MLYEGITAEEGCRKIQGRRKQGGRRVSAPLVPSRAEKQEGEEEGGAEHVEALQGDRSYNFV